MAKVVAHWRFARAKAGRVTRSNELWDLSLREDRELTAAAGILWFCDPQSTDGALPALLEWVTPGHLFVPREVPFDDFDDPFDFLGDLFLGFSSCGATLESEVKSGASE